jgi:hypothetical protein
MDDDMKIYLKQSTDSIRENKPLPQGASVDANFKAEVSLVYQEYTIFKQKNYGETEFIQTLLTHLQKLKKDKQRKYAYEIFKELLMQVEFAGLSQAARDKVQKATTFLDIKLDYFCSYTRKGLPYINSSYKQLIYDAFTIKAETHPKEWKEVNYIAKLLVKYLNDHGFNNYFIDTDKIVNGEEIEQTVFNYCGQTIVLLLLAQQETFRDREDETNWCYKEYHHYITTHDKRKFLVFKSEDLVRPEDAGDSILDWFNYMATEQGVFGNTIESDCSLPKFRKFVNDSAKEIRKAKEEAFREIVFS